MSKVLSAILSIFIIINLTACSTADINVGNSSVTDGNISIVTTIFPEYDWVREIAKDRMSGIDLTLLSDNGADIHSYQPSADDILKIINCDIFIYVGGESDEWVEDALAEAVNKDMKVINLLETLGDLAKEEETKEGMQAEKEEEAGYDEHVWLSLKNAHVFVTEIANVMGKVDPAGKDIYLANADAYNKKLKSLDDRYKEAVAQGDKDTLLFADRFPFRYLAYDYGLDYYAAFSGCSAETEASFETIVFLSAKVDELGLDTVLTIDGSDQRVAKTVIRNTSSGSPKITVMNSMQSVTASDISEGMTYLSVMEDDLEVLRAALE